MKRIPILLLTLLPLACSDDPATRDTADEAGDAETVGEGATDEEPGSSGTTDDGTSEGASDTDDATTNAETDDTEGENTDVGETGSEAAPTSLEVEADGQRIGYLMSVAEWSIYVWDDEQGLLFSVFDATGNVGGPNTYWYPTDDCSGTAYVLASSGGDCGGSGPNRRRVWGNTDGWDEPSTLFTTTGAPTEIDVQSYESAGQCIQGAITSCVMQVVETNAIPTSFPTPITIVESTG
ncbi:hypothetical protein PPSIR1_38154 [Plesiocystis pacifica SIR-1]|uniref:Uncharacterized protein n=1 Tax=Plesiocystis pacifica SIR-1 TaxID=391625 RepID=A6GBR0_9BACT|nr:hypothetical protein [Plesiocystis pacifica]EDM76677.1 hypothetical protein PPSIR1_38154 [Plesiocystis pacifica SIR-1]